MNFEKIQTSSPRQVLLVTKICSPTIIDLEEDTRPTIFPSHPLKFSSSEIQSLNSLQLNVTTIDVCASRGKLKIEDVASPHFLLLSHVLEPGQGEATQV